MNNEVIDIIIAEKAKAEIIASKNEIINLHKAFLELSTDISKLSKTGIKIKTPKEYVTQMEKATKVTKELNVAEKETERIGKAVERQYARKAQANSKLNKELIKTRYETQQLVKVEKENVVSTSRLSTEYQKLNVEMNKVGREVQNLIAKRARTGSLTKKEEIELKRLTAQYNRYRNSINNADTAIRRHQRNVGNYGTAIKGLAMNFRTLASAFGFTSGIYLFVEGLRDAFRRVREFDKSMQNLAGVFRTTRDELKPLEEQIISVAGVTIRTSNEVAQLAETLATLGKSPDQIKNLLKPVIDLSLGLNAAADEAGEFLVQMLNAFGATDDEAEKYADTIATIRTSTTLDFQKMRDSFQYIAPISRILGKDLAYTGSVVGILADNSLKAEQAGRLLSTAQIKLATQGKTLDDALRQINEAYKDGADSLEILALSNDLFGKQASKVGAILALNTEAIEINAQAIRDNGGALTDLTDRQLESLDAKLKILDSSYESFILTIEKGDGVVSKYLTKRTERATQMFRSLAFAVGTVGTKMERATALTDGFAKAASFFSIFGMIIKDDVDEITKKILEENKARETNIDLLEEQSKKFIALHGSLAPFTKAQQDLIDKQKEINLLWAEQNPLITEEEVLTIPRLRKEILELEKSVISLSKKGFENLTDAETDQLIAERKLIKEKKDLIDKILGIEKSTKKTSKAVKEQVGYFEALEKAIKEVKQALILDANNLDADEYSKKLKDIQDAYNDLKLAKEAVMDGNLLEGLVPDEDADGVGDRLKKVVARATEEISNFQKAIDQVGWEGFLNRATAVFSEIGNLVSTLYDAKIQRIDDAINQNDLYYANLLDNEELSAKQRNAIEAEQERRRLELEKKKREEQRRQAVANKAFSTAEIIINTAVAISKASPNPYLIALAAALGAVQLATVIAQPIPQFEHGLSGGYEGEGIVNDQKGSRYKELIFRGDTGKLEMHNERNKKLNFGKKDMVLPANQTHDIFRQVTAMNIASQGEKLNSYQSRSIEDEVLRAINKVNNPIIHNHNTAPSFDYKKMAKAISIQKLAHK